MGAQAILNVTRHLTREELEAGLTHIRKSPREQGLLEAIVVRPGVDERRSLGTVEISAESGVHGDRWAQVCWMTLPDGSPHPDVQVCIMNSRAIALVAQQRDRWAWAGDNLFIDLDLSNANLPRGTRLGLGTTVLEITAVPHNACGKFADRYGVAAAQFVNSPIGRQLHLRGIYAKVVQGGAISVGDPVMKLAGSGPQDA